MLQALAGLDRRGELNAWCVGSLPMYDTLTGTEFFGEALIERCEQYRTQHVRPDFPETVHGRRADDAHRGHARRLPAGRDAATPSSVSPSCACPMS